MRIFLFVIGAIAFLGFGVVIGGYMTGHVSVFPDQTKQIGMVRFWTYYHICSVYYVSCHYMLIYKAVDISARPAMLASR